jgi:Tfp pilus assembly protein FimT
MAKRGARGIALVELALVLSLTGLGVGVAGPVVGRALDGFRVIGAAQDLYGAIHLTRARARSRGVMHALVIATDGRSFRVVEDPANAQATVFGPHVFTDGVTAFGNTTIRFSPKGFAVPFGTITVRAGDETRRLVVNLLGRVRVDATPPPP